MRNKIISAAMAQKPIFKTFVSEKEIEETKKKRQEEWEKVRTAEQPLRELLSVETTASE